MRIPTNIWLIILLAIIVSLCNIYDILSTLTGLSLGAVEMNPLFNGNYLFKLSTVPALFIVTMAIWWWTDKRKVNWTPQDVKQAEKSKKLMMCLWIALTVGYLALVVNNTLVLIKLMETVRI
jgi:hypothetical protein